MNIKVTTLTESKKFYYTGHQILMWNATFEDCVENVQREDKTYLMGGINNNLLNKQVNKAWTDYMKPFGLTQLVSVPTRVTGDSSTRIGHIYSSCPKDVLFKYTQDSAK